MSLETLATSCRNTAMPMSKILTNLELDAIERRIEEIVVTIDQCYSPGDDDVLHALENELETLVAKIEQSLTETRMRTKGKKMKQKTTIGNVILPEKFQADQNDAITRAINNLMATFGKRAVLDYLLIQHNLVEMQPPRAKQKRNSRAV